MRHEGQTSISSKAAALASGDANFWRPTSSRFSHFRQCGPGRLEFLKLLPHASQSIARTRAYTNESGNTESRTEEKEVGNVNHKVLHLSKQRRGALAYGPGTAGHAYIHSQRMSEQHD
jgi:hypothetical protein